MHTVLARPVVQITGKFTGGFFWFIILSLLAFILRAFQVNSKILCTGVATYLLLGLPWAFPCLLVERLVPDSFAFTVGPADGHPLDGFNSLYFSITTLATSGYGEIVPVSGLARMLVMTESVVGLLYLSLADLPTGRALFLPGSFR